MIMSFESSAGNVADAGLCVPPGRQKSNFADDLSIWPFDRELIDYVPRECAIRRPKGCISTSHKPDNNVCHCQWGLWSLRAPADMFQRFSSALRFKLVLESHLCLCLTPSLLLRWPQQSINRT
jgi:hypothetical protein